MTVVQQGAFTQQPVTTQANLRRMLGEVQAWNPDAPPDMIRKFLANAYREVVDHRLWYGLLRKGLLSVPDAVTGGSVTLVTDSQAVTGTGTAFTTDMVGRQLRVGFSFPIYTIQSVESATQLTLDLPWSEASQTNVGYNIFQNLVSFGENVKMILACVNQKQGYRMHLHIPQEVLNIFDTWRTTTGWTFLIAGREPSTTGGPQFELYPAPTFRQSFPFLAYVQPPDLVNDGDFPVPFVRSDLLVRRAIAEVLRFRGKNSAYYDPTVANVKHNEFMYELNKMASNDNNLYQKDLVWEYWNSWPIAPWPWGGQGSAWNQSHDVDSFTGNV